MRSTIFSVFQIRSKQHGPFRRLYIRPSLLFWVIWKRGNEEELIKKDHESLQ